MKRVVGTISFLENITHLSAFALWLLFRLLFKTLERFLRSLVSPKEKTGNGPNTSRQPLSSTKATEISKSITMAFRQIIEVHELPTPIL
jgi:hypothetical protein